MTFYDFFYFLLLKTFTFCCDKIQIFLILKSESLKKIVLDLYYFERRDAIYCLEYDKKYIFLFNVLCVG